MKCPVCDGDVQHVPKKDTYYCWICRQNFKMDDQIDRPTTDSNPLISEFAVGIMDMEFQQQGPLDPNDKFIGTVDMARRANDSNYYRLYFTPRELIIVHVPTYLSGRGGLATQAIKSVKTFGKRKSFREMVYGITHGAQIKQLFDQYGSHSRSEIRSISVKRGLGDYVLTIELPDTKGFFGKKRDIRKFLIDKDEYRNIQEFLPDYYGDITTIK